MKPLRLSLAFLAALAAASGAVSASEGTFSVLVEFNAAFGPVSGGGPYGSLIASGSTLYGMTNGASYGAGTIFSVGMNGTNYQNLASFTGTGGTASGYLPRGSLVASGSTLYGMTSEGAFETFTGVGNVFSVGTNGTNFQNLVSFTRTGGTASGADPVGSLIAVGGTLYGMTQLGGAGGHGNVFSVGTGGTNYQNLVSFTGTGGTASGLLPSGSLIASGSTLYGMTAGSYPSGGLGTIFSVGSNGTGFQNLVSFTGFGSGGTATGAYPAGSLLLSGSTLYGMTTDGPAVGGNGNVFSVGTNGTGFQNLVSFTGTGGTASGRQPYGSLILSSTRLYGMTSEGGVDSVGNIFSVGIDGSGYQDLYDFTGGTDGGGPRGDLLASGGTLFGMANYGGNNYGTVFALAGVLPTPEPGTLALAGCGAAAVAAYRWRRRRRRGRAAFPSSFANHE